MFLPLFFSLMIFFAFAAQFAIAWGVELKENLSENTIIIYQVVKDPVLDGYIKDDLLLMNWEFWAFPGR